MAVDAYCIIKGFNIFKNKTVSMVIVPYLETVQPFPFNQGVECLNACIIIGEMVKHFCNTTTEQISLLHIPFFKWCHISI